MSATQKLARQMVPPRGEDLHVVQGVIRVWDPDTFENVVEFDGVEVPNVPVASGVEALTYNAGDVVLLEGWFPGGKRGELGIGSYWIRGRVITPGSGAAERTINWLETGLVSRLVRLIFSEGIAANTVFSLDSLDDTDSGATFVDLDTPGPTVPGVEVSETGRALVLHGARIRCLMHSVDAQIVQGRMSFAISGATTRPPAQQDARVAEIGGLVQTNAADATTTEVTGSVVTASLIGENFPLNPGTHTFTAKYAALVAPNTNEERAEFSSRFLTVIPF